MGNDPLQLYKYYQKDATIKEVVKETINGIVCTKSELWNL